MIKRLKLLLQLVLLVVLFFPGRCSAQTDAPETIAVPVQDWTMLKESLEAQRIALQQSKRALQIAKAALQQSQQELTEAKALLQILSASSGSAEISAVKLRQELTAQKQEIEELQQALTKLQQESAKASDSLKDANEFLQITKSELVAAEKREKKLKTERGMWRLIAIIAGGIAIAK